MITNLAFADEYVVDIPWDKNPAFAFSNDTDEYLKAFDKMIDELPVPDLAVRFSDEVWDFRPYFKNSNSQSNRLLFTSLPDDIIIYCKFFVLYKVMNGGKISSANLRFIDFRSVIKQILKEQNDKPFPLITTQDIVDAITRRHASASTTHNLLESMYQIYYFIINNYHLDLPVELDVLKDLGVKMHRVAYDAAEETKIPNIPEEYYNKVLAVAVRIMRDETEEYDMRATACMLVMLTQLGMRLGDLLALRVGCMHSITVKSVGKDAEYIHYTATKPSKPHAPLLEFDMFATPICAEAYKTLENLRKECEFADQYDYLYVLKSTPKTRDEFPVANRRFNVIYKQLMNKYMSEDATRPWTGIPSTQLELWNKETHTRDKVTLYIPETRQYRVHLCTALYNQGVSLFFIQKYMGHLSNYMVGYYVRPKNNFQEDLKFSGEIIKEIAGEGIAPLGGDNNGKELRDAIAEFVRNHEIDVYEDTDAALEAFGDSLVMRAKTGGVCIKSTMFGCKDDKRSNHLMCAYGSCPNLFHFYHMANETYFNFKQLQKTYKADMKTNHTKAAGKELQKIRDIVHRKLLPELDQMDEIIETKGLDYVLEKYPKLRDIIENEDSIRKEANKWLNMN